MDRQLVRNILPAARGLDGIDVADHIGNRHIRRSEFLDVPLLLS